MASNAQLSEEERNFTRFFMLNFKVSLEIARRFFDGVFPPAHLAQTINNNTSAIINLNKLRRINAVQLDLLRSVPGTVWPSFLRSTPVGTNATSSKDFDLTLMICLLRNLGGLNTPSNGWDQLPQQNDTLPGAYLATIKWYRNQIAHTTVYSMDNYEFTDKWTCVEKALTSLNKGQIPHEITEILNYDLDGEKAKTIAMAELEQLKNECEKEKEQIESDFLYYREGNLPKNIADTIANLVKTWIKDDNFFYETKGGKYVYDTVKDCTCILVTSNSGLGKTATIRHIALKLKMQGFEIVPVENPDEIIKYKTNKKQVFLVDDVLGKYDLSPTLLEEWERKNEKLTSFLEAEIGSTKILCTLRLHIALNKRFKNASTILNKRVINLESESNALSKEEKMKILMKHLKSSNFSRIIETEEFKIMCENNYAFPLLCKLVSNSEERFKKRIAFFKHPISLLSEELDKISIKNKELYCILVICMLYNGSFSSSIFDIYSEKHDKKIWRIMQTCGLQGNKKQLEYSAFSAIGSYFTKDGYNFRFIHDALEETVGCHFFTFNPTTMLSECDILFIRDRITIHSNYANPNMVDENIVIIKEDELSGKHLKPLYNRFCEELTSGRFSSLLMSQMFRNRNFVREFGSTFDNKYCTLKSKYALLINSCFKERNRIYRSITKKALEMPPKDEFQESKDAISRIMKAKDGRRTLMYWIVAFGCHAFFEYAWNKMSFVERKWILGRDCTSDTLVKSFFPLAVLGGCLDIVTTLIRSGADVNSFSEFSETPLYIAVKSGRCDMVRLLVENGALINLRYKFSMNIPISVISNKHEMASLILEYDLNQTELHKAVRRDDLRSLKYNVRSENIDCKTKNGWTVLHYAVMLNNLEAVKVLFHKDFSKHDEFNFEYTPELYITPKVNMADKNGLTAVHLAVINNNIEILSLLLCNKADVKIRDDFDRTLLHYAMSESAIKVLLTHNSRVQCLQDNRNPEQRREYGKTQMPAFSNKCFNIILNTSLRKMCHDFVNMPDREGNTPLHSNVKRRLLQEKSRDCIETLLENGASPYVVNDNFIPAYELIESSYGKVKYIGNTSNYRKLIMRSRGISALIVFSLAVVTLGIAIYSFFRKESQNSFVCIGRISESGNITLIKQLRSKFVVPLVIPILGLSSYIIKLSVFFWRMVLPWQLNAFWSVVILSTSIFIPFIYVFMILLILVAHIWDGLMFIIECAIQIGCTALIVCSVLCSIVMITYNLLYTAIGYSQYSLHFDSKHDLYTLNITALNCTEFNYDISCTSLANNITYNSGTEFSAQCHTDPNITRYNCTVTIESGLIDWSEIGLVSLFCIYFWLNVVCAYIFLYCMFAILIFKFGKSPFFYIMYYSLFNIPMFILWLFIMFFMIPEEFV